ncbi:hypothetical protein P9477_23195 [Enterobacter mori]|jgi:hypothetical protein|uniref:hypothetical protein n=1 Tax=Enterobacter mori TaxID=539813 RepID=UPI001292CEAA
MFIIAVMGYGIGFYWMVCQYTWSFWLWFTVSMVFDPLSGAVLYAMVVKSK